MTRSNALRTCPRALVEARLGGLDPHRYAPPDDARRAALADAIEALSGADAPTPRARARAAYAGFEIVAVDELPSVVLVRERPTDKRGGGAYLLRLGAASRVVVQAPHTFFDEGTLTLGCALFDRAAARALFIETAHRYKAGLSAAADRGEEAAGEEHPADVAHAPSSAFQAATGGVLRGVGLDGGAAATVVQLHGFAAREGGFAVVVSSGERRTSPQVDRVAAALARVVPGTVLRFPGDIGDLGGTTNVQGALVRAAGGRFLHLELSSSLRGSLEADEALRATVLDALAASLEGA